ncbi:MAG: hypothetical protein LAO05_14135 [Acidobacteriia bacterium]|nr:hypothetical protein [Terriglobia bacterium]
MSLLKRLSAALCAAAVVLMAGVVEAQMVRGHHATSQVDSSALPVITTPFSLPDATEGVAYSLQFVASGGSGGYQWSHGVVPCPYPGCPGSWGELPPGLSLSESGLLQGTPTASGNFIFWVLVDDNEGGSGRLFTLHINPSAGYVFSTWVPVASHVGGLNGSEWHTDVGVLNPGASTASVEFLFHGASSVARMTASVQPGVQSTLVDAVGQLGASGSVAIEVLSDQPVKVTSRTYNQIPPTAACLPGGTQGQDYPAVVWSNGLVPFDTGYLAGLTENASYRCNIGLVNTGTEDATVVVELFDGAGTELTSYTVSLTPGQWAQETQPFKNKARQTAMDRGYAKVGVLLGTGSGVFAFASVIDNITNDPTTVTMQR